jgi:hypothetical protein
MDSEARVGGLGQKHAPAKKKRFINRQPTHQAGAVTKSLMFSVWGALP